MGYLEAMLLGLIQGLTEFLPVSSSGHLVILSNILGVETEGVTFEVLVHFGTLLAVFLVFRDDIISIIRKPFQKLSLLIIVGTIPTAIIGLCLEDTFEKLFSSITVVGFALLITGVLLWISESFKHNYKNFTEMKYTDAIFIGIAQGAAITPGISRSGTTIALSLILGLDKKTAARYSFLLSIPVILGTTLLKLKELIGEPTASTTYGPYLIGTIVAAISGYFAIKLLLKFLQEGKLRYFSIYCWIVGFTILLINFF